MKQKKLIEQSLKAKEGIINGLNKMGRHLIKERKIERLSMEDKEAIIDRLNKVKGQIDNINAMVESDDEYYDIIKQIEYSRRALNAAEILLLESHSVPLQ